MTETLLELQAVEVSYGQARALNGVNLTVPKGRIVSLLGGNASGKSTTMKTILGLVRPDAGRVLLDGKDITTWPTSRRVASGIASVPEARRIFAPMTVEENLLWAPTRGATEPASATTWRPSTTASPASGSDGARRPGPCRAGNSRCSPSPGHS